MRRRSKILAALAAVALPMTVTGVSSGGPPAAVASTPDLRPPSLPAFKAASQQYGVPESVLLAVSYAETRWDDHQGKASTSGGYGPMHLTAVDPAEAVDLSGGEKVAKGESLRTLVQGSELTGLDPAALRNDTAANIAGGAALLAEYQRSLELPVGASTSAADWYGAISSYAGAADKTSASAFADDVYAIMARGAARTTNTGQQIVMPALQVTPAKSQIGRCAARGHQGRRGDGVPHDDRLRVAAGSLPGTAPGDYGNHDLAPTGRRPARSTTSSSTTPRAAGRAR